MRLALPLLLTLLLGAAAPAAMAVERVVVSTSFSRIFELGEDGQWRGLGVDVVRTLAARAGDTARFEQYPWARAQAMVERGQADILVGLYRSPERLKRFAFTDQGLYRDRLVFYARRESDVVWRGDFRTIQGRRVAAVRGWHYGERFDQARSRLDISEVAQLDNAVQMLVVGRVDLLASNERNSGTMIDSLRLGDALVELCPDFAQLDGYLAFPRDPRFAALRNRYNALFNDMVRSGELQRLATKNGVLVPPADGELSRAPVPCKPLPDRPGLQIP